MPKPSLAAAERAAWRAALAASLLLPLALLHARALAEILIAGIDVLFLLRTAATRNVAWLRQPFLLAALAWWLWLSVCSALGTGGLLLGLLAIRLPVLVMALGTWVLADAPPPGGAGDNLGAASRHALWIVLAAAFCWIGLEAWQQYLTGSNLFGQPRWVDGALTGPFAKPRAGPAFILLFFPALLPALAALAARPGPRARLAAVAPGDAGGTHHGADRPAHADRAHAPGPRRLGAAGGTAARRPCWPRAAAGVALVAALPWASPAAAAKLVAQTIGQLAHFSQSDYGLIFTRAITVAELHPWLGQGFDGFRRGCHEFWSMHGIAWLGIPTANLNGGLSACNIHPHNYYLEALDDAGLPGLVLFTLMVAAALARLARGVTAGLAPLRAGVLAGAVVALWPVASTSAFTSMPNGGWVFLLLGLGFAAAGEQPGGRSRLSNLQRPGQADERRDDIRPRFHTRLGRSTRRPPGAAGRPHDAWRQPAAAVRFRHAGGGPAGDRVGRVLRGVRGREAGAGFPGVSWEGQPVL